MRTRSRPRCSNAGTTDSSTTAACPATTRATRSSASSSRERASATTSGSDAGRRHGIDEMTIKWVKSDPLVMNGEPFCYGTRLTVRNLLEMRANRVAPADVIDTPPELGRVGIAEAFAYASVNKARYMDFFDESALRGPGFSTD